MEWAAGKPSPSSKSGTLFGMSFQQNGIFLDKFDTAIILLWMRTRGREGYQRLVDPNMPRDDEKGKVAKANEKGKTAKANEKKKVTKTDEKGKRSRTNEKNKTTDLTIAELTYTQPSSAMLVIYDTTEKIQHGEVIPYEDFSRMTTFFL
jgi:hypothetical protein